MNRAAAASLAVVLSAVTMAGCSDDKPEPPAPTTSASNSPDAGPSPSEGQTFEPVDPAQYLIDPAGATPLASASHASRSVDGATVKAEVLSVTAGAATTALVFQLTSTAAEDYDNQPEYEQIKLVDPAAKQAWLPYQFKAGEGAKYKWPGCLCPQYANPVTTTPIRINAVFPPLPESLTQVQVRIPGFSAMTVPVTRS